MVSTTAPIQTYVKTVPKIELEAVSLFVCMVKVLIGKPQTKNTAIARCIIEAGPIDPSFSNVPLSHSLQMGSLRTASGLLSGTNLALPMQWLIPLEYSRTDTFLATVVLAGLPQIPHHHCGHAPRLRTYRFAVGWIAFLWNLFVSIYREKVKNFSGQGFRGLIPWRGPKSIRNFQILILRKVFEVSVN